VAKLDLLAAAASSLALRLRRRLSPPARRPLRRVLIIDHGAGIGDAVFFLPVVEELRRGLPGARLVWAGGPDQVCRELIPATGLVDETWEWDAGDAGVRAFSARVRAADFDAAVLTAAAPAHRLQRALARVPLIAAHRFEGVTARRALILGSPSRAALGADVPLTLGAEHSVRRNLRLLEPLGLPVANPLARPRLPIAPAARERAAALLSGGPWVGVHVGPAASYNFRSWAPELFGALCAELSQAWPGARFALIGGPGEKETAARARAAGPADLTDLTGAATLAESFALIERCALMVSCDTGPAKAAMALGVPTVTLWGPSSPVESGAYWDADLHLDVSSPITCAPCSFSGTPRDGQLNYLTCGHHACLGEMRAAVVRERVLGRWPVLPKR
jgi:ADP-heptose:LPS heptosyltransferase